MKDKNEAKSVYTLSENEKFINPYSFLSVKYNETERNNIEKENDKKLTGVLECSLFPKTPFCIPDNKKEITMTDENGKSFKHNKYPFFNYDGVPAILGSSLRGMIRSVYEAISDSCFSTSKDKALVTNRSTLAFEPGVLIKENNKWELYKAKRLCVKKELLDGLKYGEKVNILDKKTVKNKVIVTNLEAFSESKSNKNDSGYLFIGEPFSEKKYESVFCITKKHNANKDVIEKNVKKLDDIYKTYYNNNAKTNSEYIPYKGYERAVKKGVIPIWYSEKYGGLKFSLACIGRYSYDKNMGEILKGKAPCKTRDNVCKACALFGMASKENIGSRIRITDAVLCSDKNSYSKDYVTLEPLGSPRISYLPFYLKKSNNIKKWSYDNTEIRGRKFYWHSEKVLKNNSPLSVNSTVEIMYPKNDTLEFKFNIYYDNITENQLNELIWTITLGDNRKNSTLCFKIGHGKPLGLGSAKIVINNKKQRSISDGYKMKQEKVSEKLDIPKTIDKDTAENVLIAMDMKTTEGKNVSYPYIKPADGVIVKKKTDDTSMKWFSENFKLGKNAVPKQYLPEMSDSENREIKAYVLTYTKENDEIDKSKIYEAIVINAECEFPIIKFENGTTGSIKKEIGLKKGDRIKVKFKKLLKNKEISYKFLGKV